jgi:Rod binding domain-containing protein
MIETEVKQVIQGMDPAGELEARKKRLLENCREFESVMTSYMMKTMHQGFSWLEDHDSAREIYEDMFTQEISKQIGRSSVLGIGDMLYSRLEPLLETKAAQADNRGGVAINRMDDSTD